MAQLHQGESDKLRQALRTGADLLPLLLRIWRPTDYPDNRCRDVANQAGLTDAVLQQLAEQCVAEGLWHQLEVVAAFMQKDAIQATFRAAVEREPLGEAMPAVNKLSLQYWYVLESELVDGLLAADPVRAEAVLKQVAPRSFHVEVFVRMCFTRGRADLVLSVIRLGWGNLPLICWQFWNLHGDPVASAAFGDLVYQIYCDPAQYNTLMPFFNPFNPFNRDVICLLLCACLETHMKQLGQVAPSEWRTAPVGLLLTNRRHLAPLSPALVAGLLDFFLERGLQLTAEQVGLLCGQPPGGSWETYMEQGAGDHRALFGVLLRYRIPLAFYPEPLRAPFQRWHARLRQAHIRHLQASLQVAGQPGWGGSQLRQHIASFGAGQAPR